MTKRQSMHIAVIGIDGSGKSICYEGLLEALAIDASVAGIGDRVLISNAAGELVVPEDILKVRIKSALGVLVKVCRHKLLYEISKLTELVSRSKIQEAVSRRYNPRYIVTDGAPLINILAWSRYYHPESFTENEFKKIFPYLSGEKKICSKEVPFYSRHLPELLLINRVYRASLNIPDTVIFLKTNPEVAMRRIIARGKQVQAHENAEFLQMLQEAYMFVCSLLQQSHGAKIFEIVTDELTPEAILRSSLEIVESLESVGKVNIVATTMSGSIKDWKKLDIMEDEFRLYHPDAKVHIVDSHREALVTTKKIIKKGGRIIVSAGGAGTFNSVLEGCCSFGPLGDDFRLAFLRKGSADLIGKVLNIPDELGPAVKIISEGIIHGKVIESDILEIEAHDAKQNMQRFHMIGFGGAGVFGDIPYFTESRFVKYYKGILGYFFGDRGPFFTGANLALAKRCLDKLYGRQMKFRLIGDAFDLPFKNYLNVIIMNGDLGRHFPIAQGIPLNSGDFQVTVMEDRGFINAYKQMLHAWKGDLDRHRDKLGVQVFRTKTLRILPDSRRSYFLNVDGLLKKVAGKVEYRIYSQAKLITG